MKKIIVLLSVVIFFVTGCSVTRIDYQDMEKCVDSLISKKVDTYNVFYEGYKYYLPKGVSFLNRDEYNAILKDGSNNRYYLYVEAISYYHKVKNNYKEDENAYFSKKISKNKKTGYLQIDKINSKYFIQFVYNYAKMEAYVDEKNLMNAVINMCSILRTIRFNDVVLESLIGENILDYKEENYTLFKADSSKEDFLDVVEREETDLYKKDIEDEKIDLDY